MSIFEQPPTATGLPPKVENELYRLVSDSRAEMQLAWDARELIDMVRHLRKASAGAEAALRLEAGCPLPITDRS